jgi:hypothetical protein
MEMDGFVQQKSKLYCKKSPSEYPRYRIQIASVGRLVAILIGSAATKLPDCALEQDSSACMHANTGRKSMDPVA